MFCIQNIVGYYEPLTVEQTEDSLQAFTSLPITGAVIHSCSIKLLF